MDVETSHRALLQRLFPEVQVKADSKADLSTWTEAFAKSLKSEKAKVEKADNNDDAVKKLEKQVEQYKTVLTQTENMLNTLQSSVESAETDWKARLASKDSELDALREKNAALNESLKVVKHAEEVNTLSGFLFPLRGLFVRIFRRSLRITSSFSRLNGKFRLMSVMKTIGFCLH